MPDMMLLSAALFFFCSPVTVSPTSAVAPKQVQHFSYFEGSGWAVDVTRGQGQLDGAFVTRISVGTPPRTINCKVDTGFADVWLSARLAEQSHTFVPQTRQDVDAETPGRDHKEALEMTSSRTTLRGYRGMDTIRVGSRVFENQSVYFLDEASLPKDRDWDGICGLGHYQIATKVPALYSRVAGASPGGLAVFGLMPDGYGQAYTVVNKVPLSAIKPGTLAWVDAEPVPRGGKKLFWVVPGGVATKDGISTPVRFVINTATKSLLVPPSQYRSLVRDLLPAQMLAEDCGVDVDTGNVVCDCAVIGLSDIMPLRVSLGEQEFLVNVTDLFDKVPTKEDGEVCQLQIQQNLAAATDPFHLFVDFLRSPSNKKTAMSSGTGPQNAEEANFWVLGNAFLKRFCLFLDFEKQRVGFAEPAARMPAAEEKVPRVPAHQEALGHSATEGAELAADMQALASQNEQLRKNISNLQNTFQVAKKLHVSREDDMRNAIYGLEDEQKMLLDRQTSLLHTLAEVAKEEKNAEGGPSPAVLRSIEQENDQLRSNLAIKQERLQRSEGTQHRDEQAMPWSSVHNEVKALSAENAELLRMTADLRHRNQDSRNRQANFYLALLVSCIASSTVLLLGTYSKLVSRQWRFWELAGKDGQETAAMDMNCSMLERCAAELVREGVH